MKGMVTTMTNISNYDKIFNSQKLFRAILEAAANPAKKVSIEIPEEKPFGENTALIAVGMTLLSRRMSFCAPDNDELTEQLSLLTHSEKAKPYFADYIFLSDTNNMENLISCAKYGTLANPHNSATIIISDNGEETEKLCLCKTENAENFVSYVSDAVKSAIEFRGSQAYEYPQGIDMIFINGNSELLYFPRTVIIS